MSKNLTAFLAQNAKKIDNVTFTASERFTDPETGGPMPWEICCITAAVSRQIRNTRIKRSRARYIPRIKARRWR